MKTENISSISHKSWGLLLPPQKQAALKLLMLMLMGMGFEMLGVGMVMPAVALLTQKDFSTKYHVLQDFFALLGNPSEQTIIIVGMLFLVIVYLSKSVFLAFLAWRQMHFTYGLQAKLSNRLFTTYLNQPYTFHLQRNSAELIRNALNEVGSFTHNVTLPILTLLTEMLALFGLSIVLFVVEPLGALVVVTVLGATSWAFYRLTHRRIEAWGKARLIHEGERIKHLQQALGGVKDLKLLGRESEFLAQYDYHNLESARMGRLQQTILQLPRLWLELLAVVGLALLVISMLLQQHSLNGILPVLGLFAAAAFRLMPSINRILVSLQSLRYGVAVIDALYKEINLSTHEPIDRAQEKKPMNELVIADVNFCYPGVAQKALSNISIKISRGSTIGFIGASGAGKSTLVDLILGLISPDSGEVKMNGENIQLNIRGWQDQVGYVPQSIYLTDDTLRRNIAFGIPDEKIDDSAVMKAVKHAQLVDFIQTLPDGLGSYVGERGVRLSGGQRQRIGIARALYHDPEVLVLDEATSSLDIETESGVLQAINALKGSKTILIVAHRLSTVKDSDWLYRLEKGKIIEDGPPKAILTDRFPSASEKVNIKNN